jgi:hypothetical protein
MLAYLVAEQGVSINDIHPSRPADTLPSVAEVETGVLAFETVTSMDQHRSAELNVCALLQLYIGDTSARAALNAIIATHAVSGSAPACGMTECRCKDEDGPEIPYRRLKRVVLPAAGAKSVLPSGH